MAQAKTREILRSWWLDDVLRVRLAFGVLRAALGAALLVRGYLFLADTSVLVGYMSRTGDWFLSFFIEHYVVAAHLGGGLLLAIGLLTRFAALLQVPALFGAVFFVHFGDGLLQHGQSLELSSLVLLLLVLVAFAGPGAFSVDAVLARGEANRRLRSPVLPTAKWTS